MNELQIETRNRSRSKTPFLRSSCDNEQCAHTGEEDAHHSHHRHGEKKKKSAAASPTVQTIVEETVEVTSSSSPSKKNSRSSNSSATTITQQKTKTSDYSSDDASPDTVAAAATTSSKKMSATKQQQAAQSSSMSSTSFTSNSTKTTATTTATMSSTIITKSQKQLENSNIAAGRIGGATTSTPKTLHTHENFAVQFNISGGGGAGAGAAVVTSSRHYNDLELSRQQTSQMNNSGKSSLSNILSYSSNGDLSDHLAYREYKEAGEYWKKYPKTDYTYSELSPHRREVVPGVIAMPNMSRSSLEQHYERINYMIERDPAQEEYIRRRYMSQQAAAAAAINRKAAEHLIYDSQDEVDVAQYESYRKYYRRHPGMMAAASSSSESWFTRMITSVVTSFSSVSNTIFGGDTYPSESTLYRQKIAQQERGFFSSILTGFSSAVLTVFHYVYLFISSVLCFDTWLLSSSNAENRSKKRFLLFLLMVLPLLMLAAWSLLDNSERIVLIQKTQNLLPLTIVGSFQSALHTIGVSFKDFFQYIPTMESTPSQILRKSQADITGNIRKSLTSDEYQNILNHVNSYVEKLVDIKLDQQQKQPIVPIITPEMSLLIANIVRENVHQMSAEGLINSKAETTSSWSDEDIHRIADLVQMKLETGNWLSQVNSQNFYNSIDLDKLLLRVVKSPKMTAFVDGRISSSATATTTAAAGSGDVEILNKQQLLIDELNKEIAFIKLALSDKLSENQVLHLSIRNLKLSQDDLQDRIKRHELDTDNRLSSLLSEIEAKLLALRDDQFVLLNKQIKLSLVEILGFKKTTAAGHTIEDIDLQNWVRNMFVAKEFLEQKLIELNKRTNATIKEEIDRSGMILMRDISERLKVEILQAVELKQQDSVAAINGEIRTALSEDEIRRIVKSVLAIYDADKTGLVDFALESAGGQILSTRCTENYHTKSAQISVFGVPLWYPSNTPRIAISPNVQPGECWAFQGFPGFLVLKLNSLVYITGFTLEHIPKSLAPYGRIDSAPKNFTVWGLEHEKDQEPVLFGEYEYVDIDASLQYFPVLNRDLNRPYEIVELRVETNHGNPQYTCLYRFRVHGKPPAA